MQTQYICSFMQIYRGELFKFVPNLISKAKQTACVHTVAYTYKHTHTVNGRARCLECIRVGESSAARVRGGVIFRDGASSLSAGEEMANRRPRPESSRESSKVVISARV